MILADKIIEERKRLGLSQEQLAEQMNVSRQSISKWEGAQSTPDLNKIIKLSEIFGVSTDYLLKDNLSSDGINELISLNPREFSTGTKRAVSLDEAHQYLEASTRAASHLAYAIVAFILAMIPPVLFDGFAQANKLPFSGDTTDTIGAILFFPFVALGIVLLVQSHAAIKYFKFLKTEPIETDYGVTSFLKEQHTNYEPIHTRRLVIGIVACVLALPLPLFSEIIDAEKALTEALGISGFFLLIAFGCYQLIFTTMIYHAPSTILRAEQDKMLAKGKNLTSTVSTIYWCVISALYFGYSFITNDWGRSWIVWVIAGILYAAIEAFVKYKYQEE